MKKGLIIGLAVAAIAIGILATHPPRKHPSMEGTETAEQLAKPTPPTPPSTPATPPPVLTPVVPPAVSANAPAPAPTPAPAAAAPAPTAPVAAPPAAQKDGIDIAAAMADRVLGKEDAPVTVTEYASLTCPHCAHFAINILPEVKTKLIDTGRMRLIFRDFPLDQLAMKAAKMARCAPKEKYFDLIEVIFKNRDRWLTAKDPENALMQLGALTGMDDGYMRSCIDSTELDTAILNGVNEAQSKFVVQSTPTFIFNYGAETISGAQDEPKFEDVVNRLTASKK